MASAKKVYFNPNKPYDEQLSALKKDFEKRWEVNTPSPENNLVEYMVFHTIGEGAFGEVKLVQNRTSGKYSAVKCMSKASIIKTKQLAHIFDEKRTLSSIRFPFAIYLEFSSKDADYLYLGLPLITGGELFTYHRSVRRFNETSARFYAAQVFLCFEYLHHCHIIYRDLKPENILIDRTGYIRVTDFGFSKKVTQRTLTLCGTPDFMAPEIIQSKPYAFSVDWWSFGVFVYEMVAGHSPFSQYSNDVMLMYSKICDGEFTLPINFSDALKNLISGLMEIEITKRLGCSISGSQDIKFHEWFKGVDWFRLLNQEIDAPYVPPKSITHMNKELEKPTTSRPKFGKTDDAFKAF